MSNKIPTAEEFFNKRSEELGFVNWINVIVQQEWEVIEKLPIEFAKLHVEAALKEALESIPCLGSSTDIATYEEVEKAVLNAYPEDLIK